MGASLWTTVDVELDWIASVWVGIFVVMVCLLVLVSSNLEEEC